MSSSEEFLRAERFPPTFSQSVVKLLARDVHFLSVVRGCVPPEFFSTGLGGIYLVQAVEIIYSYYDKYRSPCVRSVFELERQRYVAARMEAEQPQAEAQMQMIEQALFDAPMLDADYVRTQVYEWAKEQACRGMVVEMKENIDQGREIDVIRFADKLKDISSIGGGLQVGMDLFRDADFTYQAAVIQDPRYPVPLGINSIDSCIAGGPGRKEMLLFEGPPNRGKSTVLAACAAAMLKQGKKVVHVTLEQSQALILQKVLACLTGIPPQEFRARFQDVWNWVHFLRDNTTARLFLGEFATGKLAIEDLYGFLNTVQAHWGHKIDAIVLDYPDLMKLPKRDSKYDALADLYTQLRGIAVEFDAALVTATQTNREGSKKERVTLQDLAACFEKAAIADVILAICQTDVEYNMGQMRLFVAKNRVGPKYHELMFNIDFNLARLEEKERKGNAGAYPLPGKDQMLGFLNGQQSGQA